MRAYYADLAANDWHDAAALMQPSARGSVFNYSDSPAVNLVRLTTVKTTAYDFPTAFSGIYAKEADEYGDIWQIFVTYNARVQTDRDVRLGAAGTLRVCR